MTDPIIVTATMGDADFAWADNLRREHFPPERNMLSAHVTLFHHLPPSAELEICAQLARLCAEEPPPRAMLADVLHLGRGVAFRIDSADLMAMRQDIADAFHGMLTPQDAARPRLHVTIQNKVTPQASRALFDTLRATFVPRPFAIVGLAAWWYRGGPWEAIVRYRFRG
ncbi:2'-5' RNA ligase family protein [Sphingobium algorifonticola]|uniref:2'-5' RNA ligase family protein n=1 Tax=Sphingobium algorifonticola TaxID=2008318 RepID=A0A437J5B3_9SPHN|nr:2'-5' RNA ligase family protein [Sphingobium algorifonticola]RVT40115.1 2'-5' RNA ligase family protein [Sphingobium algorifonticola]